MPLCIFYEECFQMVSVKIIEQILFEKEYLLNKIKKIVSKDYKYSRRMQISIKKDEIKENNEKI